jgi:LuxR family maltose regulon positive regulatory protein
MPTPLRLTKLNLPQSRHQRVCRPELVEKLNAGLSRKLILVSSPAGYGKTTLVLEWLSQLPDEYSIGWISVDQSDNDPVRFLAYMIAAIGQSFPGFGKKISTMLQNPQTPPYDVVLTNLLNEMAEISTPFILVLDDYHSIQTPRIHKNLATWLEYQPASMVLVVISREDPLLPIARLRARGQLTEIRQDVLCFSHPECVHFIHDVMGISISTEDIAALERRTEGWITGLQLAAISMQHHPDPSSFIKAFTGSSRYILDYLMDEVFSDQSENMQNFLIKTSILDRLSGPLCESVTGYQDSQERLEALEQSNLFIIPLDQTRSWYRYHRLFSELLQNRLRRKEGESPAELHIQASQWFEENNYVEEAIQHACAANHWDRTARILFRVTTEMLRVGEAVTLVRWFGMVPKDVLMQHPQLCFEYTWPLMLTGHYKEAAELLDHVELLAQDIPPFLGEIMAAQAYLARAQNQHDRMVERSERARTLLPADSLNSRSLVAINLGLAYWHLGDMEGTEKVLKEAIATSQASQNHYALITAIILQGRVLAVRGQLRSAEKKWLQAIEAGGKLPINALAYLDLSAIHYEWNQLSKADSYLQGAFDLSRYGQNEEFEVACWMMQACLSIAAGNAQAAREALSRGQALIDKSTIPELTASRFEVAKLRFALSQDDLRTAIQLADRTADNVDSHNFCRFTNLSKAKLFLTQNQTQQAENYLAALNKTAQNKGWRYALIVIRAYQTLAARNHEIALCSIEDALKLAKPEGFLRIFLDIGAQLMPYLQEAARCGVEPGYVGQILSNLQKEPMAEYLTSHLAEPLSKRELEVLHLVAAGLSNREIAQNLVISLGTAKTHIHNIYGKLDVSNRAQAISRARDFELV